MNDRGGFFIGLTDAANGPWIDASWVDDACQLAPVAVIPGVAQDDLAKRRRLRDERERNSVGALRSDDLTQVSQPRGGALGLRRERIDLGAVVTNAIAILRPEIARRGQRLVVKRPETAVLLDADPGRLEQVLTNLLHNAVKFTGNEGELRLTVEHDAAWVTVRVADTGIGIAPHELPYVFDAFRQVNSSSRCSSAGVGIGLAVVRDLVELHGGRVIAMSDGLGAGSEFILRLPALRTLDPTIEQGTNL